MLNDLTTAIQTISSEELDKLLGETPDTTVKPDNLAVGKKDEEIKINQDTSADIPVLDMDNLPKGEEDKKDPDDEDDDEDQDGEAQIAGKKKDTDIGKGDKKKEEKKEESKEDAAAIEARKEVLTNTVNYLVDKGLFKDFKDRETMQFDDDSFAEMLETQLEAMADERYDGRKKSAGEYGEAILDYLEKGGDPDQMIDLFKERRAIQDFDIADDESQKDLVVKWYKEVHGWKTDKIKGYVDMLLSKDDGLKNEAEEIKERYEDYYKTQLRDLQAQQDKYEQDQKLIQKQFETNISKVIDTNENFDDSRKRLIKESLFRFRKLPDGSPVNDLYIKFAEWQKDPAKYVEFAEFIVDHDAYIRRKVLEAQSKATDKKFNFIKKNAAVSTKKGSSHIVPAGDEDDKEQYSGTNFSLLFKK